MKFFLIKDCHLIILSRKMNKLADKKAHSVLRIHVSNVLTLNNVRNLQIIMYFFEQNSCISGIISASRSLTASILLFRSKTSCRMQWRRQLLPLVAAVGTERDVSECKSRLLSPVPQGGWNSCQIRMQSWRRRRRRSRSYSIVREHAVKWRIDLELSDNFHGDRTFFFFTGRPELLKIAHPRAMPSRYGVCTSL